MNDVLAITSNTSHITTIGDVEDALVRLGHTLEQSDMLGLCVFNEAYTTITQAVRKQLSTNYFSNSSAVELLDVRFVTYYLEALEEYISTGSTTPAWQELFERCHVKNFKRMHLLALGVNAHVTNDLGMAVFDVHPGRKFGHDFVRVNKLIDRRRDEIIARCALQTNYNWAVRLGMYIVIRWWRRRAWDNYCKLSRKDTTHNHIEQQSLGIAKILHRIPWPM